MILAQCEVAYPGHYPSIHAFAEEPQEQREVSALNENAVRDQKSPLTQNHARATTDALLVVQLRFTRFYGDSNHSDSPIN
jgi:hypothetical protein